jgi:hypothetical protein
VVDVTTGATQVVGHFAGAFEMLASDVLAWSPDGTGLLIKATPEGAATLVSTTAGSAVSFTEPVIDLSPDGRYFLHQSGAVSSDEGSILYTLPYNDIPCSNEGQISLVSWAWSSGDNRLAYQATCSAESESVTARLDVIDLPTGSVLWQQDVPPEFSVKKWTPDGEYLLLQQATSGLPADAAIWRLAANGSGKLEMVVEQGILLDVIPQWGG